MNAVNLGPLTTAWAPPPACSDQFQAGDYGKCAVGYTCASSSFWSLGYDYTFYSANPASACWPGAPSDFANGYYSPGLVCPSGHTTACISTFGSGSKIDFGIDVASGTVAGCCPSGYACGIYTEDYFSTQTPTCVSTATSARGLYLSCNGPFSETASYEAVPSTFISTITFAAGSDEATFTIPTTMLFYAPLYRLNWQNSDLVAQTSSATLEPTASNASASTATAIGTATATSEAASSTMNGLSTGARAGIGAGVAIGVLAMVGFLAWFMVTRRRSRKDDSREEAGDSEPNAELYGLEKNELLGQQDAVHELPHDNFEPTELLERPVDGSRGDVRGGGAVGGGLLSNEVHELGC